MNIIFIIGIIMGLLIILIPVVYNMKSSNIILKLGMLIIILSVCLLGAFKDPPPIYDVYRHYLLIDKVKNNEWDFFYAVFKGIPRANSNYTYTYLYNLILVIIAKWFFKGALPFISALTYYSVFYYVYFKEFKGKQQNVYNLLFSIIMCSAMMPYLYVYSGIRNNMGMAIAALAIYRYFEVSHNLKEAFVIIVIGMLIHPISILSAVVLLTYHFKPRIIWLICIGGIPIILDPIMEWCRLSSGNDFLFRLGAKYYNYTKIRKDDQGRVFLYSAILLILLWCLLILFKSYSNNINNCKHKLINKSYLNILFEVTQEQLGENVDRRSKRRHDEHFAVGIWWYTIFALAFTNSYTMMIRFPYFLGCLSPFFIRYTMGNSLTRSKLSFQKFIVVISTFMIALLILYENICWLSN